MPKKILIIDDSPASIELTKRALEGRGYLMTSANNGRDGMKALLKDKPDLVVVDMVMPDMSDIEVCIEIKKTLGKDSPKIIALTGMIDAIDAVGARRAGADDFCVKSSDMAHLVAAVEKLIA